RFCEQTIQQNPDHADLERWMLEEQAFRRLYEKPWYEFHAVQLAGWIEDAPRRFASEKMHTFGMLMVSGFSGELGRLVEQYYWRFRFERAAITGSGARAGASAGGKAKAKHHQKEHFRWQHAANEIWAIRPELTKTAVATAIKKRLRISQTAKHIAR